MRAFAKCLIVFLMALGQSDAQDMFTGAGQFEEILPPAVSEAAPAMSMDSGPGMSSAVAHPDLAPGDASIPGIGQAFDPVMDQPIPAPPAYDIGIGQAYDMPISDVVSEEAAEVFSTNNWFRGGRWYSRQDFVMLLRSDLPTTHVAVDLARNTINGGFDIFQTGTLNSKQADFTFEGGTRLTLGRMLGRDSVNRDHGIEFTFFGLFDFAGRANIGATNPTAAFRIESLLGTMEARSSGTSINGTLLGFPVPNQVPDLRTRNLKQFPTRPTSIASK